MLPAVVAGIAGGEFPRPIEGQTQALKLRPHSVDVGVGPLGRRHLILDGGVLRRKSEGVPAHGLEHGATFQTLVASDHVPEGVAPHVPHVHLPTRVSKHRKTVEGRLALIVSFKDAIFSPARLRVCFNGGGVVGGGRRRGHGDAVFL